MCRRAMLIERRQKAGELNGLCDSTGGVRTWKSTSTKRRQRNEGVSQERIDPRGRTADQPHKMPVALKAAAATVMLHLDTPT